MKPKPRKCKNKPDCHNSFIPQQPFQDWCSIDCGVAIAQKKLAKKKAQEAAKSRQQTRMQLLEHKPLQYWLKRAEKAVNAYIRERDAEQPCISCGTWDTVQWEAGHFRPVGGCSSARYDYANIARQCHCCNDHKGGNQTLYEVNLIARIGKEEVERIKAMPKSRIWTREDLMQIEAKAKKDLKQLKGES